MHKLFVVHSSHPSEAVRKALALKGIPYKTVELLIPTHVPLMRLRFGVRSVPALKLDGGAKVSGSRNIMRTLDELVADPPLLPPADEPARAPRCSTPSAGATRCCSRSCGGSCGAR